MQLAFSGVEALRLLVAANGATIMLLLLASRWLFSIVGMMRKGSSSGRSPTFNILALAAYVAGASQFMSEAGPNWLYDLTGFFFALNIGLIFLDTALIYDYGDTPTPKTFLVIASIAITVAVFLGLVNPLEMMSAFEQPVQL